MTGEELEVLWEEYQKYKIGHDLKGSYLDDEKKPR